MGSVQVKNLMSELKLRGMLDNYDETLIMATKEEWGHEEFMDVLTQAEYDYREKKRRENRVKSSKIRKKSYIENFDFTAKRSITKTQIKDLSGLKWLDQGRPLLLIGPTGVGKTFIAEAIGHHACRNKKTVLFLDVSTFLENLSLSRSSGSYLKLREKLSRPDLLIIDDFGLRKFTSVEAQDLCEILEQQSEGKSTIITTQLPLDHWSEVINDVVIADAIIDRLIHGSINITITGSSYRKEKAKKLDGEKEDK